MNSYLNVLFYHMLWADAEIWKKVLNLNAAQGDDKIKKLIYHLHQVQYAFYFLWNDAPIGIVKLEEFKDLRSIAKWGFEYQQKLKEFINSDKTNNLENEIKIPWSVFVERITGKKAVPATLDETMLQVVSHSSYHRGQINLRFRELGGEPAVVDLIFWIWLGKPATNWGDILR